MSSSKYIEVYDIKTCRDNKSTAIFSNFLNLHKKV